ncbi:endonuclease/exonuclease/phosphatase family protein [Aporhodopirellula aestuarii]|uniref:Endonuclease/exonuclease/phosphatase family protein n=1 Tax=Aporhodopirellula aestuarii TaxID=2950107 RepID=A0ABT0U7W6_9BACT|nr:endonuclease/exonuclease/phosphatase family protein [Aporhodopirellula aestuarii]MCM2372876.1 endonuclease/exonuclease/phosphatase family protein [Aporhodopirellula aestuarii]
MVKWLWSIIWGKKSSRRRSKNGAAWSVFRWFTPGLTITGVLAAIVAAITGQVNLPSLDSLRGTEPPVYEDPVTSAVASTPSPLQPTGYAQPRATAESVASRKISPVGLSPTTQMDNGRKSLTAIRVATFNIKVFGDKKSSDAAVMQRLAAVFMQFDIVAVQEIRGDPDLPINRLLTEIARQGGRYRAVHGPPIGRTSQTECYGFVWDQDRIDLVPQSDYMIDDRADRMHREPMVASFQSRVAPIDSRLPFRFTMINVHTDPDLVRGDDGSNELNVLDDVFQSVRNFEYETTGEEDFLLVGDLNVDVGKLAELGQIPGVVSLVGDVPTNTLKTKTYDHILIDSRVTTEYVRRSGVFDLESFFGIDQSEALKLSDHLPVWAEFSVYESPRQF